jgi:hypothetical protein
MRRWADDEGNQVGREEEGIWEEKEDGSRWEVCLRRKAGVTRRDKLCHRQAVGRRSPLRRECNWRSSVETVPIICCHPFISVPDDKYTRTAMA